MTEALAFAGIAVVLAVLALACVFAPLLRHQSRGVGIALLVACVGITAGLYLLVGTPKALDVAQREAPRTIEDAIVRLEDAMEADPSRPEGWRLLADAYREAGRLSDAAAALARAAHLLPRDPEVLTQAAHARAAATPDRRFDAQAVSYLERALAMDPEHQRARWFLGVAQRQAGRSADAARTWGALLDDVDATTARALRPQVDEARRDAGLPSLPAAPLDTAAIRVRVSIDPALRSRLPADATVFVLARAPGTTMPLAVQRIALGRLPAEVELTDADGLMPTRRLSQVREVEVLARASASGAANASAGDLESAPRPTRIGNKVDVAIDRVRP